MTMVIVVSTSSGLGQNKTCMEQPEKDIIIEPTSEENKEIKHKREVKMNKQEKGRIIEIVPNQKGQVGRKRISCHTCIEKLALGKSVPTTVGYDQFARRLVLKLVRKVNKITWTARPPKSLSDQTG